MSSSHPIKACFEILTYLLNFSETPLFTLHTLISFSFLVSELLSFNKLNMGISVCGSVSFESPSTSKPSPRTIFSVGVNCQSVSLESPSTFKPCPRTIFSVGVNCGSVPFESPSTFKPSSRTILSVGLDLSSFRPLPEPPENIPYTSINMNYHICIYLFFPKNI